MLFGASLVLLQTTVHIYKLVASTAATGEAAAETPDCCETLRIPMGAPEPWQEVPGDRPPSHLARRQLAQEHLAKRHFTQAYL